MHSILLTPTAKNRPGQRGIALLLMFLLLFMAGVGVAFTALSNNKTEYLRIERTGEELLAARDALLAFAVTYGDSYGAAGAGPGHLLCPDSNNNGQQNAPCAGTNLGRLPRNITLPSGNVFEFSRYGADQDQQFWYGVAGNFKPNPAGVLNSSTAGALTLDGVSGYAAVIIAPGLAVNGQSRTSNTASNYLEDANATAPDFITNTSTAGVNFNDQVIGIRATEIMAPTTARVAEAIKSVLNAYNTANARYPVDQTEYNNAVNGVAPMGGSAVAPLPAWYFSNSWLANTVYTRLTVTSATVSFTGCTVQYTLDVAVSGITKNTGSC